ncbi:hypothetical protein DFQ27_006192 [Actinomortierella ambigua]|uniref:Pentacotripeptide-repeat region of PRORP domain-containing protein n=1 Tax=Actinomortierella ambigua TaxID=1343610 RepID=A0A9P6PX33_9FUNG|nr:hypothetical protein DFQ27_006192 [Actinomortierella ambigua]
MSTEGTRQAQHVLHAKRPFRSLNPSTPTKQELCRECETARVQQGRRISVSQPHSNIHIRAINSQSLLQQRQLYERVQDISNSASFQDPSDGSTTKARSSLKDRARHVLNLFHRKDFGGAIQLCKELEASIRQQKCKPSTLEHRITELELFRDPIITRAFEILGAHTPASDSSSHIAQSFAQLIDHSIALQLLPDRTSAILQYGPRVHVLDYLFARREAERAMAWIWLWDKIDAVDWRQQVVTEQQRASLHTRFADVDREDFVLDVSRMLNKSYMPMSGMGTNLEGARGLKTPVRLFSPESVAGCFEIARYHQQPLSELLRIHQLDKDRFGSKSFLYGNIQTDKKMDLLSSWTEGILSQRSLKSRASRAMTGAADYPESLWRELAMVGMLSSELTVEDVVLATGISRHDTVKTHGDVVGCGEGRYQDALVTFVESLPVTDARLLLGVAIRKTMSPIEAISAEDKTEDYRMLLQGIIHQVVTRLQHRGLISHALELRFRAACAHDEALLSRVDSAVIRWRTARVADRLRHQQHRQHNNAHQQQQSNVSSSPQVQSFLANVIEPRLARMCALAAMQSKKSDAVVDGRNVSPRVSSSDFFSEWFTTMAEWSPCAGPMLRFLETPNKHLLPTTTAYRVALNSLLQGGELDMAVALHLCAYDLVGTSVSQVDKKQHHFPPSEEILHLIDHLTQGQSIAYVERAQWIVDHHLRREKRRQQLSFRDRQPANEHFSQILDTAIISSLVRGWISHGDFGRVQEQAEKMRQYGLQPNKYFYSSFLKALVDLEPTVHNDRLVGGGDGQARQVGRQIAVHHMLQTRYLEGQSQMLSPTASSHYIPTALDEGWRILFQIIREQEERHAKILGCTDPSVAKGWSSADPNRFTSMEQRTSSLRGGAEASVTGLDRMKSLVHQMARATFHGDDSQTARADPSTANTQGSRFQPNIHIFSILLDAYSRRGNTEAILELLADMTKLGMEPNEVVYTILANAFAKSKNLRVMDQVIRKAEQSGVDTGRYMYNIALNTMVKMKASSEKIHEFLQQMARRDQKQQENDTFAGIDYSTSPRQAAAHSSDMDPPSNPFQGLDQVTLSTLMSYHVDRDDADSADQILRTMTSAGFVPDKSMYFLVLGARIQQHHTLAGLDLLRFMRMHSRHTPDSRAWKGLLTCAMEEQVRLDREQDRLRRQGRRSVSVQGGNKHHHDQQSRQQQSASLEEHVGVGPVEGAPLAHKVASNIPSPASESLVVKVLQDLWTTVDRFESRSILQPLTGNERLPWTSRRRDKSSQEQYVRDVFASSSWMTLDQAETKELAAWMQGGTNNRRSSIVKIVEPNDGKGRHGLLRRILDHLLRDDRCTPAARQDVERRCYEALWVVRQVEQHGLSLGDKWKWQVVGRQIERLTSWSPQQIRALLQTPRPTTPPPQ